jgi:hypothetical protein
MTLGLTPTPRHRSLSIAELFWGADDPADYEGLEG